MSGGYNHCYYMVTWNVELMTFGSKLAHIFYYFAMSTSPCEVSQGFFLQRWISIRSIIL
jgi:VanZ family protein